MILQLIERYYTFYWAILIALALLKIIFSIPVEGKIHGTVDIFAVLLKWYNEITLSMAESDYIRKRMQLQNLLTIFILIAITVVSAVSFLKSYF
jgi:hypothetical protein